jgi:glycosyltransferase involved in cell wall biosynthesis
MVLAPALGTSAVPVWVTRQIQSLTRLGVRVDTYVFQNRRSLRGLLHGGVTLRKKVRECEADLVHVHYGAAQALIAVLFAGRPVVVSFCGSDLFGNYAPSGQRTWSGRLSRWLSQAAAFGCRRSIAKSDELRASLWTEAMKRKCEVIPNGVDLGLFHPMPQVEARRAVGWVHDDPVVVFMDRRGAWVKDPQLAQAAYAEAKKERSSLRMHVLENERPERMGLFYNAADVLLLTSRHEGSNNTVKEALACNLPVVATPCGDVRERLQGVQACHVCARDPLELGARLTEVAARRQRSDGRAHLQGLTLEPVAASIIRCYERALGAGDGRALSNPLVETPVRSSAYPPFTGVQDP